MPTPPTFDYDHLWALIRKSPHASWVELAKQMSEHEGHHINPGSLASAYDRHKGQPHVPARQTTRGGRSLTGPYRNIPPQYWHDVLIRHARTMTRIARGQGQQIDGYDYSGAMGYARRLVANKQVIDIRASGKPYIRPARADELDDNGDPAYLISPHPGLTQAAWEVMSPRERDMSALPWRPPGSLPLPTPADLGLAPSGKLSLAMREADDQELAEMAIRDGVRPEILENAGRNVAADLLRKLIPDAPVPSEAEMQVQEHGKVHTNGASRRRRASGE